MGEKRGHGHPSPPAQRGSACRGGNTKHQQKAECGDVQKPILKTHSTVLEHHRTYLRGENGGALCSVSTPKPKSDLKNKMLTLTILIVLCQLNM